ncbi:apolipoprotein N-acyltransferase [Candidatus Photodesmus katoptron]|uniref:Apolipoprotein N-acyltransferase n=1 Tax=Candidatus Photodesmus katoptron Akat1 TaxID=1236703 RepID=S3DJR4_9GAMM|nr:apolipoprotein N-acyltransferase [Candidatus Photodesmus katoptron]EPE37384.1 apolipoprotein N-acyltransferase [Candidatus Photodesmus katoptron Akat1]KEY90791.1 apolipoprotein N-acyltransferase [Candidatus Photodesmus katoptron]
MTSNLTTLLVKTISAAFVGMVVTLSFSPYKNWPLAIISPLFLFLLLNKCSEKLALLIGYAWGIGEFSTSISWIHSSIYNFSDMNKFTSLFLVILLIAYLSTYSAFFSWTLNKFFSKNNKIRFFLAIPSLWLIFDWLQGWIMTGFPWLWLGYSQIESPLANFAPLGGVEFITFIVILCSSSIAFSIIQKVWITLLIPIVAMMTGCILNNIDWVTVNPNNVTKIALIQGNIDQTTKWLPNQRWPTIIQYTDLTQKNWDSDIIIWPEAAIPAFEDEIPLFLQYLDLSAKTHNSSIITGILSRSEDKIKHYNSILVIGNEKPEKYDRNSNQRYNKYHLLPFGEFIPFRNILKPFGAILNLPMSSFSQGNFIQKNININGTYMAPALCYEIIFNERLRKNITNDTDFILTLSNDTWFGDSIGPFQHMNIARMRAKELGKPLIRATNNGITAITDHNGNIIKKIAQFKTAVLKTELTSTYGKTPYTFIGSWPLYILVFLSLFVSFFKQYAPNLKQIAHFK